MGQFEFNFFQLRSRHISCKKRQMAVSMRLLFGCLCLVLPSLVEVDQHVDDAGHGYFDRLPKDDIFFTVRKGQGDDGWDELTNFGADSLDSGFRAPFNGVYMFFFSGTCRIGSVQPCNLGPYKNNSPQVMILLYPSAHGSEQAVLELKEGDEVSVKGYLRNYDDDDVLSNTNFSGILLRA